MRKVLTFGNKCIVSECDDEEKSEFRLNFACIQIAMWCEVINIQIPALLPQLDII